MRASWSAAPGVGRPDVALQVSAFPLLQAAALEDGELLLSRHFYHSPAALIRGECGLALVGPCRRAAPLAGGAAHLPLYSCRQAAAATMPPSQCGGAAASKARPASGPG